MLWLLIGGGAFAFLMLIGMGIGAYFLFFSGSTADLDFVIDDATSFDSTRYADLWKNDKTRSAMKDSHQDDLLDQQFGLKPDEIERVTNVQLVGSDFLNQQSWEIVLTTSTYDEKKVKEKILGSDYEEKTANGKKYLVKKMTDQQIQLQKQMEQFNPNAPPPQQPCVCFHSKTIFVKAPNEKTMKKVLENYPRKKSEGAMAIAIKKTARGKFQHVHADSGKHSGGESDGSVMASSINGNKFDAEWVMIFTSEEKAKKAKEEGEKEARDKASEKEKLGIKSFSISRSGKELTVSISGEIKEKSSGGGRNPFLPF